MKIVENAPALAAALAGLCPCSAAAEILIGAAAQLTGNYSWPGEQVERGAEMAVDDINKADGVLGEPVRLILADDYCRGDQAVAAARKLVSAGAVFVAGHPCSGAAIPASKVYDAEGILMISSTASNPKLTDEGGSVMRGLAGVLAVLFVVGNLYTLGAFWLAPSYRSSELRTQLEALIPPGSSVAGDWAPFLTLGTHIKPLYMNSRLNRPSRFGELRPDYLLYCETFDAQVVMNELAEVPGVSLSPPLFESTYNGRKVILYAIRYMSASD